MAVRWTSQNLMFYMNGLTNSIYVDIRLSRPIEIAFCRISSKALGEISLCQVNKQWDWPADAALLKYAIRSEKLQNRCTFYRILLSFRARVLALSTQQIPQPGWTQKTPPFFLLFFFFFEHFLLNFVAHTRLQSLNRNTNLFSPGKRFFCNRQILRWLLRWRKHRQWQLQNGEMSPR